MSTPELAAWLLEQVAADEAAAGRGRSHPDPETFANDNYGYLWVQPDRVLAECAAKRRIVDYREQAAKSSRETGAPIFEAQLSAYDAALRALAQPYADRPGWLEEWAL